MTTKPTNTPSADRPAASARSSSRSGRKQAKVQPPEVLLQADSPALEESQGGLSGQPKDPGVASRVASGPGRKPRRRPDDRDHDSDHVQASSSEVDRAEQVAFDFESLGGGDRVDAGDPIQVAQASPTGRVNDVATGSSSAGVSTLGKLAMLAGAACGGGVTPYVTGAAAAGAALSSA